jgi:sialidase-1
MVLSLAGLALGQAPKAKPLGDGRPPFHESAPVWVNGEDGAVVYHVYGLVVTHRGTVLAFSEARLARDDHRPHHLVVKRSADGGKSWSKNIFIERADGSFWKREGQKSKLECWTNPAPLVDGRSGRIFFFYALNEGSMKADYDTQRFTRVFYRYSDDDGLSWQPAAQDGGRVEITPLLKVKADGTPNRDPSGQPVRNEDGLPCDYLGRAFHMPGPGHGIQLRDGRLLLPFWHRTKVGAVDAAGKYRQVPVEDRRYGMSTIFSDDGGKTWSAGKPFGSQQRMTESRLVELENGEVLANARGGRDATQRYLARSRDRGVTWTEAGPDSAMPDYIACDSGLVRYACRPEFERNCLLMSHPAQIDLRARLTISVSHDEGKSWDLHKVLDPGGAKYSDLVKLPDGTIGLVYGKGEKGARNNTSLPTEGVMFVRFNYAWLIGKE